MAQDLMLVGSIPYDTSEDVFRAIGPTLGEYLPFIPDGEIGERIYWVNHVAYRVLHGHPDMETVHRPMTGDGVELWHGEGDDNMWSFRVKPGVKKVRFGHTGWRLGYAKDAINSYFVFKTLRADGVIPADVRFQVCLPLPASAVFRWLADKDGYPALRDGFTESMHHEVGNHLHPYPAPRSCDPMGLRHRGHDHRTGVGEGGGPDRRGQGRGGGHIRTGERFVRPQSPKR